MKVMPEKVGNTITSADPALPIIRAVCAFTLIESKWSVTSNRLFLTFTSPLFQSAFVPGPKVHFKLLA